MRIFRNLFKKNDPQLLGKVVNKTITEDGIIFTVDLTKEGAKEMKRLIRKIR